MNDEQEEFQNLGLSEKEIALKLAFKDENGEYVNRIEGTDVMWGSYKNFAENYYWPNGITEDTDEDEYNTWKERPMYWYAPFDWINFVDSKIFSKSDHLLQKYTTMLYYGVLIIGQNELGPVNEIEMVYSILTLMFSALLNALIFGDIASLATTVQKT